MNKQTIEIFKQSSHEIGLRTNYIILLFWYLLRSDLVPRRNKVLIISALCYLLFPFELVVPNTLLRIGLIVGGVIVLIIGLYSVRQWIRDKTIQQSANAKLKDWCGEGLPEHNDSISERLTAD